MAKMFQRLKSWRKSQQVVTENHEKISVLIYNDTRDGYDTAHHFEQQETCEDICRKLGEKIGISPAMLHCFSLAVLRRGDDNCFWLSPREQIGSQVNGEHVHFRMRFVPANDNCCEYLKQEDEACLCYLYWQMKWDFVHDRLKVYKQKEKRVASRGVVVLCILISIRIETERSNRSTENLKEFSQSKVKHFYPKSLQGNYVDESFQTRGVMLKLEECQEKYPMGKCSSVVLMLAVIKYLLREGLCEEKGEYYTEHYEACSEDVKGTEADLLITVQMGNQQASLTIVHKNKKQKLFASLISELDSIEMSPVENSIKVNIRKSAQNQTVFFSSQLEAVSCVTCLDTYYRLTFQFYDSLCPELVPSDLEVRKKLRVHGPITDHFVKQKLLKRDKMPDSGNKKNVYILRASQRKYDEYEVLYREEVTGKLQTLSLGKVVVNGENGGNTDFVTTLKGLIINAIKDKTVGTWMRLNPQSEGCDILQKIILEENQVHLADDEEEEGEIQAKVYKASSVQLRSLIGQGHFTETYEARLCNREDVVAKQLRYTGIPDCNFKQVQESFQDGINSLLELRNPKFFVEVVGVVLSRTPAVLLKPYMHGNLRSFLQSPKPKEQMLSLKHLCSILVQLASALDFMEENNLCHGNLHCDNILVDKFERNEMRVHIADPGLVSLYNKLGLNASVNVKRLPWIAPELHENLFGTTIKTDMFAFGTTLWQIFSLGKNPMKIDPNLKHKSIPEVRKFFSKGDGYLSKPSYLEEKSDDSSDIRTVKQRLYTELMKKCWHPDPEERINPKCFLKTYNSCLQPYGEVYHDYNIIADAPSEFSPCRSTNNGSISGCSKGLIGHTCYMPKKDLKMLNTPDNKVQTDMANQKEDLTQDQPSPATPVRLVQNPDNIPEVLRPRVDPKPPPVSNVKHLIAMERLSIDWNHPVGQGHYGAIYKGTLAPTYNLGLLEPTKVAVKVLKENVVNEFGDQFIEEAKVMERLEHRNCVKFYGVSRQGQYLIMEFVDNDCLYNFVKSQGDRCAPETLLKFCVDIAAGMEYLSEMKVLHRDLAARNVLITGDLSAKISDFGMSKILEKDEDYYRRAQNVDKNMPVLWSAPEWIGRKTFTTKSDVWSFGVVLWEVYSKGSVPNICRDLEDFKRFGIKNLYQGQRLKKPERCSEEMYDLMKLCWDYDPQNRPTFTECHARLKGMAGIVGEEEEERQEDEDSETSPQNTLIPTSERNGDIPSDNSIMTSPILEQISQTSNLLPSNKFPLSNHGGIGNSTAPPGINHPRCDHQLNGGAVSVPALQQNGSVHHFIERALLTVEEQKLGQGGFGDVYKGTYKGRQVAIKRCKNNAEYNRFKREIDMLYLLTQRNCHKNIVEFIGAINNDEVDSKLELVMEFMNLGSLSSCLKKRTLNEQQKLDCLIQVAEGMNHLFEMRILHADLVADNVLLTTTCNGLVAKISDFGWAKLLESDDMNLSYQRKELLTRPLSTAYEVNVKQTYTRFSDIWSYGCLTIEVYSDGKQPQMEPPLQKDKNGITEELVKRLESGNEFLRPQDCPIQVFNTIKQCWKLTPSERIQFQDILRALKKFRADIKM